MHVYKDTRFVLKWDLDNRRLMKRVVPAGLAKLIDELIAEGRL